MTTYTPPEIDFSTFPESDGEPMAENTENLVQMIDLIFAGVFPVKTTNCSPLCPNASIGHPE